MDGFAPRTGGILLVDKPSGPTSYDMIRWIKSALRGVKIGHSGTLDPMATGLLILLLGPATRRQAEIMGSDKIYRAVMKCGVLTDSGDLTGRTREISPVPPLDEASVRSALESFLGLQQQIPPMFSALKKDGQPLYKLARKGEEVERAPRAVTIHEIELLSIAAPDEIDFRVRCSSGTYVRTLVEDIGRRLGTVATLAALEREAIGPYSVADAVDGEDLCALDADGLWARVRQLEAAA